MPRPKSSVPAYLHHKPSGRAYVRLPVGAGGRKTIYLGVYDSDESRREYARLIAELATRPQPTPTTQVVPEAGRPVTVNEVMLRFLQFADAHYRRADGSPTGEVAQYRQTFQVLKELFGRTPAGEFGPKALKAVRQRMIDRGWTRKLINQRVGRVRRAFKWAASEELIPAGVHHGLATVTGLQLGRTGAKETAPVGPVAEADVRATLPLLPPAVAAMVRVQRLTGMRPGEVCRLRPCDLDTSAAVWVFCPPQHKTSHRGKERVVAVGPQAQAILSAFSPPAETDYYFSPARAVADGHARRSASRKTPRYPAHMKRNAAKRVAAPKRSPAEAYTVTSYGKAVRRAAWRAEVAPALDPDRLVFLDETWAKTNMVRATGYVPKGERVVEAVPHGHWHTTTFLGGLRADGFVAPVVIDGAVNGDLFRAYVEQHLAPALRPGDVVVMGNLGSHKVAGVRAAIEAAGCRLLDMPPYSPDLNPIENAFSKLKRMLRAAAARTDEGLWNRICQLLDEFRPAECRNYFRHCGYAATPG